VPVARRAYLARIDAHDKKGAALNAIVMTNPRRAEDRRRSRSALPAVGPVGPMHCVPVIVKDNYETVDMPTTAGSLSLKGMMTGATRSSSSGCATRAR
jgi:Asp-tRNA(Asn)/Glu-tRNA(Gln) amidotransferase A subunit family amidase